MAQRPISPKIQNKRESKNEIQILDLLTAHQDLTQMKVKWKSNVHIHWQPPQSGRQNQQRPILQKQQENKIKIKYEKN